jgi:hypothetical protein
MMDVTVVPTTAGVLAVGCTTRRDVPRSAIGCAQDIERISFGRARPLLPRPDLAFDLRLRPVVARLRHLRAHDDRALRAARTQGDQANALQDVANAYAGAAAKLAHLATPGRSIRLVSSMRAAAHAYQAAVWAAAAGNPVIYDLARAQVARAEKRVAAAVSAPAR